MMRLIVVGAGGHAKVLIEAVRAASLGEIVGLVAPGPTALKILGVPILGSDDDLKRLFSEGIGGAIVALGGNALRLKVGSRLREIGYELPAVIHPAASISPTARIGAGAVVLARAAIGTEAFVDDLAIVNTSASIDHDNIIGLAAHVAPGCALAGNVVVGERALVGVGSSVRPGIRIGIGATVGAGSAVVSDVPDQAVVGGAPAKRLKLNKPS